ncbi:MAG: preprotein translocase subunit SecE [Desulfamplus sp.]|nr:preprotein translocase subunit SecE [Desulfamplus sp.]MBF0412141.1 preprotein translocase subunit SecE [Desulfamplus sp.]
MARLQKKKSSNDKIKKSGSSEENSSENNEKQGLSIATTPRIVPTATFKNTRDMTAQAVVDGELNFFQKGVQFLREVQAELKKVTWPNRKQTAGATVVVIILVFIIAAFLGLVDVTLSKLVQIVLA